MNKYIAGAGLLGAAAIAAPLFLLAPGKSTKQQRAPYKGINFAHRGLHSEDMSTPENSMAAFRAAIEAGYGMEMDVQLSKDGQVLVFHDDTLDRVCGVKGRVDEFDYDVLKHLPLCGSGEHMPLFSDFLDLVDGKVPLVVELKTGKRNRELCEKTYEILKAHPGNYCIESFNPMIVAWFRRNAKEIFRGQLAAPKAEYTGQKKPLPFLLSHCLFNVLARPQFIAYKIGPRPLSVRLSELMGAMKVCYTATDASAEKGRDAVIFEFYRPEPKYK